MKETNVHSFHIPVMGLAFSIDTPIRVARFGISSVISIVDDMLIEHMRKHYSEVHGEPYVEITPKDEDHRARRITEYLNLVQKIVQNQIEKLKTSAFESKSDIVKYFEMLSANSPLKNLYNRMVNATDAELQSKLQAELREKIVAGAIDVNIMTKVDKLNIGKDRQKLPQEFSDAIASLRGFAQSKLQSSVVLSAGMNPRLYSYLGKCTEFLPDEHGVLKKKVILKVSDYRSAIIQGKFLAKKGIWISEYRIESGLNCGGHAFATDGFLLGPILEEFKKNKEMLINELHQLYAVGLQEKGVTVPSSPLHVRITVQGGIGTAKEDVFLREHYQVDGTGWASPFLLVPEATNLDDATRQKLANAKQEDYYLSRVSPLGIPFNNLRNTTSEQQILRRYSEGKPGSPCVKKFLVSNTEFTEEPICTASLQYQKLKINQLKELHLSKEEFDKKIERVIEKACLCEDLAGPALNTSEPNPAEANHAVAVCPGPNLAYFSKIVSLQEMVGHIYGRTQLITVADRPNMFINELRMNIDYLKTEIQEKFECATAMQKKQYEAFKVNLMDGVEYYKSLIPKLSAETESYRATMRQQLLKLEEELFEILVPSMETAAV